MSDVTFKINNMEITVPEGITVLEAARRHNIDIPTLCNLKDVNEIGACRMCMVEVAGAKALQAACVYPVAPGIEVFTNTPRARKARRVNLELILSNHHRECTTCIRSENCELQSLAKDLGITVEHLRNVIDSLHEFNPMMGHRGCRLAVSYPEIAEMQTTAVINAAINVIKECGYNIVPHIMIPLVGEVKELKFVKDVVVATADKLIAEAGVDMKYEVGTMIEIPRAALTADEIAKEAEFFSFGTNDLTQMTFGFSRDDAGKFLSYYYDNKVYESDPFAHLDQNGVGKLVEMAAKLGRQTRPELGLGICGEHGGDPTSVEFCHRVGLDYVSCSPFRVPIARLAAAQAAIKG